MAKKAYYTECPRCGAHTFEVLNDYGHCFCCLYFEDYYEGSDSSYASVRSLELRFTKSNQKNREDKVDMVEEKIESQAS
jgi:hypothetical protein